MAFPARSEVGRRPGEAADSFRQLFRKRCRGAVHDALAIQCAQKINQRVDVVSRNVKRTNLRIEVRIANASPLVEQNDVSQRLQRSVVHVRRVPRDLAQRRRFEGGSIAGPLGDRRAPFVRVALRHRIPRIFPAVPGGRFGSGFGDARMHVVLRTTLPAAALQPAIANAVRELDPALPIIQLRDMEDVFRDSVRRTRMLMQLLGAFAGLALLLAAIGTYGVLSYMVAQQRREIGIRIALGAERRVVLGAVMGHGLKLACLGVVAGVAAALVLTRLMKTLLFAVRPNDPATLAGVAALMVAVAAAASVIPAFRATRVDPLVALKDE
jgi:hypothetical protein